MKETSKAIPPLAWRRDAGKLRERIRMRPTSPDFQPAPDVLVDPGRAALQTRLRAAASHANGRSQVRTVAPLPFEPILEHRCGLLLENGHPHRYTHYHMWPTSAVGAAWFTLAGRKFVRVWGSRGRVSGPRHSLRLFPDASDREGNRRCWEETFPVRAGVLWTRRVERIRRMLDRFGPPGEDDRANLVPGSALVRAYAPGAGVILSDDYARPRLVQAVVRDPSTGLRHHLTVPPRFGNPESQTFRQLETAEDRVRAAVAWTFGLSPEDYNPEMEA